MNTKQFALGILVHNRWELTEATLKSVLESDQSPETYDLYIIDNGSSNSNKLLLKQWAEAHPCKNLFCLEQPTSISIAWNLFLSLTSKYQYRTLMDNDIVLRGTGLAKYVSATDVLELQKQSPAISDTNVNPGCVKNVSVVKCPGSFKPRKLSVADVAESAFLNKAAAFMDKYNVGLLSYVPVPTTHNFDTMMQSYVSDRYRGKPFLVGGCITIANSTFQQLGYYDERLSRCVVLDYSQRASRAGIQLGFHDSYWVIHNILNWPVDAKSDTIARRQSLQILDADNPRKIYLSTNWTPLVDTIQKCAQDTKIVNLEKMCLPN